MSLDNFIPQVWSANILSSLEKAHVLADVCNRNYEGEITGKGDSVKIVQIADITVSDYTKNSTTLTYQELEDAALWLKIDQAKYFAFSVDDVDKAQSNVDIMQEATRKAAYNINDTMDSFIAGLYTEAGVTSDLGTNTTPLTITAKASDGTNTSITDFLSLVSRELDEVNCPQEGRWIVVPPWMHQKMVLAELTTTDTQVEALTNGRVGRILGFDVRMSNNLKYASGGSATVKTKVMAGTRDAISLAEQLSTVEGLRREGRFSDAIRGLHLYGGKVVQANALAVGTCSYAAEA